MKAQSGSSSALGDPTRARVELGWQPSVATATFVGAHEGVKAVLQVAVAHQLPILVPEGYQPVVAEPSFTGNFPDGAWLPVEATTPYTITKDAYDAVHFKPVTTRALKLEVQLPADNATGIHEWIVN